MKFKEFKHEPVQPDTYEASMALNQLLKIGKHAIKIHNMIDDRAEMEAWVAKKIDLAGDYVKKVHGYMQGEKAGLYDDGGMTEDAIDIFDFEKQDEYNDDQDKYGDVDKTPLTPQERQQFKQWLISTANTYAQMAVDDGVDDIGEDLSNIEDQNHKFIPKIKEYLKQSYAKGNLEDFAGDVLDVEKKFGDPDMLLNDRGFRVAKDFSQHATNYEVFIKYASGDYTVKTIRGILDSIDDDPHISSAMLVFQTDFEGTPLQRKVSRVQASESVSEDAGDDWSKLTNALIKKYGEDKAKVITDFAQISTDSGPELMKNHGLTPKGDSEEDMEQYFQKFPYLRKMYDTSWMDRLINIAGAGPDYGTPVKMEDAGDMDLIGDGAENLGLDPNKFDYYYDTSGAGYGEVRTKSGKAILQFEYDRDGDAEVSTMDNKTIANIKQGEQLPNNVTAKLNMIKEDAGEGHMSKSTLYHTAKYAIELMQMIKPGDDLEGWVQSKLNKAADYLQGVYNYEEYQKLNPYREELDSNVLQRHAGIVQKHIDEILARETSLDDVDTKPGMMRILAKRVNEVEKEIAKKTRKKTDESGILYRAGVKKYGKAGMKAIQSAAAKGANHQEIGKIKDKHLKDSEVLDEGLKDWAKGLAMAGVVVAGMAGVGSIQDAIDRSIPAVQAMETALEMAQDQGNDELAKMIKSDLSAVKVRLSSGKDLGFVKGMQDKYSKFVKTEGLAYESKLVIMLNQQLK